MTPFAFRYRAFASGQLPVHWVVHFDARGEHTLRYRCKNVNLVEKTVKGVEDELECLCREMRSSARSAPRPSP